MVLLCMVGYVSPVNQMGIIVKVHTEQNMVINIVSLQQPVYVTKIDLCSQRSRRKTKSILTSMHNADMSIVDRSGTVL
jgi:hypothetical protein